MRRRILDVDAGRLGLRIVISLLGCAAIIARLIWPQLKIDAVTLGLAILVLLPWLSGIFESLEFPGGWKVSYRKLEEAAEDIPDPQSPADQIEATAPSWLAAKDLDPNLALVGLRVEIERRLDRILSMVDLPSGYRRPLSVGNKLRTLGNLTILEPEVVAALYEVVRACNAAAHGAYVPADVADFAFNEGPRILAYLDEIDNH